MRNIWVAKVKGIDFGDEHVPTFCDLDMLIFFWLFFKNCSFAFGVQRGLLLANPQLFRLLKKHEGNMWPGNQGVFFFGKNILYDLDMLHDSFQFLCLWSSKNSSCLLLHCLQFKQLMKSFMQCTHNYLDHSQYRHEQKKERKIFKCLIMDKCMVIDVFYSHFLNNGNF